MGLGEVADGIRSYCLEAPKVRNSHSPAATPWVTMFPNSEALKGRHNVVVGAKYVAPSGLKTFIVRFPRAAALGCGYFAPSALRSHLGFSRLCLTYLITSTDHPLPRAATAS